MTKHKTWEVCSKECRTALLRQRAAEWGRPTGTGDCSPRTRLYRIWIGMKGRCECPTNSAFAHYGGNGVKVCRAWQRFETFKRWALKHGYADHLSIDRKNPFKGYSPQNCRWATSIQQARENKRHHHFKNGKRSQHIA